MTFYFIDYIFVFISSVPQKADALAINCGCSALKRALAADGAYTQEDAEAVAECHGGFTIKICLN
ncbi:hypothetical protein [Gaoshiqia sp. Z1-71]|uniref:hypothetical protein n=1 Tax=Gaoshiqia hydrogeniformans TaxID=3290090 RepID=UPI003BF8C9A7